MVKRKATLIFCIILIVVIAITILLYIKFWQEPKVSYSETDNPKLIRIREELSELKKELKRKGVYNCCIRNDCNWCAIYMGHCPCADLVFEEGNEESCPECAAAWNRKQGRFPSIDPNAIKVTTFGIYGFEKSGHHYLDVTKNKTELQDIQHPNEDHH